MTVNLISANITRARIHVIQYAESGENAYQSLEFVDFITAGLDVMIMSVQCYQKWRLSCRDSCLPRLYFSVICISFIPSSKSVILPISANVVDNDSLDTELFSSCKLCKSYDIVWAINFRDSPLYLKVFWCKI